MKCAHCKQDFKKEQMLEAFGEHFCCVGCQGVYEILHEKGLDGFYQRLNEPLKPVNLSHEVKDYSQFVKKTKEGFDEIYLSLHGIHCAACIWLNEKALIKEKGVLELDINSLTHKVRVVFDSNLLSLKQILTLIQSIGYSASAYDPLKQEFKAQSLKREFYAKLVVGVACVMNVMWIAISKYAGLFTGIDSAHKDILNFAEFILATPVLFYTGSSFYQSAFKALKNRSLNMDTLVISGASLAYIYSLVAMFTRAGEVYFDSVAMIICFVFIGKYLEILSKKRALDTLDGLNDFLNSKVAVFNGHEFVPKEAYEVQVGDRIELKAGDKVLIDGICLSGEASFDSSSLSGESAPILIDKGKELSSACVLIDGRILYEATRLFKDSRLACIIEALELASMKKARIQSLVDAISAYFSRTMLTLALLCFGFWLFYQHASLELSLINAISLLIIACPCALALATPVCNLIALNQALKQKVLFKSAAVIEDLSKCNAAVFDKTGVLTKSELEISNFFIDESVNLNELLAFVKLSKHPVARSVASFLEKKGVENEFLEFKDIQSIAAKGIEARLNEDKFIGGSETFLNQAQISCQDLEAGGLFDPQNTHFTFVKNKQILAFFEFKASLNEGAKELIAYLKAQKMQIYICSGDTFKATQKVAHELGITHFKAACSPENKKDFIEHLSQKNKVLMIGDGINDALALKYALVAISLRSGADLAVESCDVLLLKNDLNTLESALRLSKKTFKIIKQNLALSLIYNALTLPLAFLGLINPLIAAASMSLSSVLVVLNALRIRR